MTDNGDLNLGRMRILDAKAVNLDGFSVTDPDLGLVAMRSPHDPEPSLVLRDGRAEMYGPRDEVMAKIAPPNLRRVAPPTAQAKA